MTKPTEIAVLTVNGQKYEDWESVLVKHALREQPPYHFRFTCSEGMPLVNNLGEDARPSRRSTVRSRSPVNLRSAERSRRGQVVYDARKHHIEIQGAALTLRRSASVVTKTGEFNNDTFEQIARLGARKLRH